MPIPHNNSSQPWYARIFQIDTRALAAFRIGMGLVTLWDLGSRSGCLIDFYTDDGVLPRALFAASRSSYTSVYFASGSLAWAVTMFALHALFALMLIVGFRTKFALAGCLVMGWSLAMRNPIVLHGGDGLMLWAMFWSLFLPLQAVGSVDAQTVRRRSFPEPALTPRVVCSIGSAALLIQVVLVYVGAVTVKTNTVWASRLSGVHYFFSSHWGTPLGHELAKFEWLTRTLNVGALFLESCIPLAALLAGPPRLGTRLEPVLLFGGAKQAWGVMGEPPFVWARMGLDARLADGSTVTLIDARAPERAPLRLLIPPRDLRIMKYQLDVMIRAMNLGDTKLADALCRSTARCWDAVHPAEKRIKELTVIYDFRETRPPRVSPVWPVKDGNAPIYTWRPGRS